MILSNPTGRDGKERTGSITPARARTRNDHSPSAVSAKTYKTNTIPGRRVPYRRYVATRRGSDHRQLLNRPREQQPRVLSHIVPREELVQVPQDLVSAVGYTEVFM